MGKPSLLLDPPRIALMSHYLRVHQQSDGGWGTHIESPSTMFGTVLCHVSLRLLGAPADDPACVQSGLFIRNNGGATHTGSWAKLWLCILGCMDWRGHNSVSNTDYVSLFLFNPPSPHHLSSSYHFCFIFVFSVGL